MKIEVIATQKCGIQMVKIEGRLDASFGGILVKRGHRRQDSTTREASPGE